MFSKIRATLTLIRSDESREGHLHELRGPCILFMGVSCVHLVRSLIRTLRKFGDFLWRDCTKPLTIINSSIYIN